MGFLIIVIIYINMQQEYWNGKVCAKSTSTQNSKEPVCYSRPAQLFTIKSAAEAPGFIHGEEVAVSPFLLNF